MKFSPHEQSSKNIPERILYVCGNHPRSALHRYGSSIGATVRTCCGPQKGPSKSGKRGTSKKPLSGGFFCQSVLPLLPAGTQFFGLHRPPFPSPSLLSLLLQNSAAILVYRPTVVAQPVAEVSFHCVYIHPCDP